MVVLLLFSIVFQCISAVYAFKLIKITQKVRSWLLIAIAIVLMIIRRVVTLYDYFAGEMISSFDWAEEIVAFATSALLALGIAWISPVFESIQKNNNALVRSNRALKALSKCNGIIIHEEDEKKLMEAICHIIVEDGGYRMAWVGTAVDDEEKTVLPIASCGFVDNIFDDIKVTWSDDQTGQGPTGMALKTGQPIITREIEKDSKFPWRSKALTRDYKSSITFPMKINDHIQNVLNIYSDEIDAFDEDEVKLLTELSDDLSFAINVTKLREQRNQNENKLLESQQRLSQLVERAPFGIIEWDKEFKIDVWNPAAQKIFGFSNDEALSQSPAMIFQQSDLLSNYEKLFSVNPDDAKKLSACENLTKEKEKIFCNWYNFPLFDKENVLIRYASFVEDVTEKTNAEIARDNQLMRLNALRRIDKSILGSLDLNIVLSIIVEESMDKLDIDAIAVYKYDPVLNELEYVYGDGFNTNQWQQIQIKPGEDLVGKVFVERKTTFLPDLPGSDHQSIRFADHKLEKFVGYIGVPLISKGEIKGVMEVFSRSVFEEKQGWMDYLLMLAGQAAIGIENLDQYQKLQILNIDLASAYDKTIEGWSRTLELRDEEIEGHASRVANITIRMAQFLGFQKDELIQIRRGALLHDIGKIILPDSILHKPGPLDEDEWRLMKKHPQIAYNLLYPIKYLRPSLNIPYLHHEKWDGSGYPLGLQGDQIPLEARIFAIIDVWDALSSDRPYRKAWQSEKIITYLKEQSGTHFDPMIVEHFLNLLNENGSDPIFQH